MKIGSKCNYCYKQTGCPWKRHKNDENNYCSLKCMENDIGEKKKTNNILSAEIMDRYKMTNDYGCGFEVTAEKNDNGEWIKWEDVKVLIEENEKMKQHILSIQGHISNLADMTRKGLIYYGS